MSRWDVAEAGSLSLLTVSGGQTPGHVPDGRWSPLIRASRRRFDPNGASLRATWQLSLAAPSRGQTPGHGRNGHVPGLRGEVAGEIDRREVRVGVVGTDRL